MSDHPRRCHDASIAAMRSARRLAIESRRMANEFPAAYAYFMAESSRHFRRARSYIRDVRKYRDEIEYRTAQNQREAA